MPSSFAVSPLLILLDNCAVLTSLGRRIVHIGYLCTLFSDCPFFSMSFVTGHPRPFSFVQSFERVVFLCRHLNCLNRSIGRTCIQVLIPQLSQWSCCFSVFSSSVRNRLLISQSMTGIMRQSVLLGSHFRIHSFSTCRILALISSTVSSPGLFQRNRLGYKLVSSTQILTPNSASRHVNFELFDNPGNLFRLAGSQFR